MEPLSRTFLCPTRSSCNFSVGQRACHAIGGSRHRSNVRRNYHSYDHAPPASPFNAVETSILSAALRHVPIHGFSDGALHMGARDAGYLDASAANMFPRRAFELVNFHLVTRRLALKDQVQFPPSRASGGTTESMGTGEKVRTLVLARLRANGELVKKLPEAIALMALPTNVPPSIAELAQLVDEILFLAGDASVDSRWYAKRASLAAIYSASELFMTQDGTPDYIETERFVDARLAEATNIGAGMRAAGEWMAYSGISVLNVLRSKGVRI